MTPRQNRVRRIALASLLACAALPAFAIISFSPGNTSDGASTSTQIPESSIDVPQTKAAAEAIINAEYPRLDALYKDLHAHPELAFQETRTAAKLAAEMRKIGFEVTENVGKTAWIQRVDATLDAA